MKPGERLRVLVEYDLYGLNLEDLEGTFIKFLNTEKCLVYFEQNGEWAELFIRDLKRAKPGHVSKKNKEFISRIKTMEYTT